MRYVLMLCLLAFGAAASACDLSIKGIGEFDSGGSMFVVSVKNRGGIVCSGAVAAMSPGFTVDGLPDVKALALAPGEVRVVTVRSDIPTNCATVKWLLPAGLFVVWPPETFIRTVCVVD